jgi:hypothetical protein
MTKYTSSRNKELFTELSLTESEIFQGGYKFTGYDFDEGRGVVAQADRGLPNLKHPNTIDSVYITEGKWQLYNSNDYTDPIGGAIGPGWHFFTGKRKNTANSFLKVG